MDDQELAMFNRLAELNRDISLLAEQSVKGELYWMFAALAGWLTAAGLAVAMVWG